MVSCAVQLKSKCPFSEHFWLKPEDSGWTSHIQITTSKKKFYWYWIWFKSPRYTFLHFLCRNILRMRIFPDPLVKLQQNRAREGHSFKVFNTFLITTGIIKPLYHTMDFKSTFIYLNTSEISVHLQYTSEYSLHNFRCSLCGRLLWTHSCELRMKFINWKQYEKHEWKPPLCFLLLFFFWFNKSWISP